MVHFEFKRHAGFQHTLLDGDEMHVKIANLLLRVADAQLRALAAHRAGIANLPAGLGVEWRLVHHHCADVTLVERRDFLAVFHKSRDYTFGRLGVVT